MVATIYVSDGIRPRETMKAEHLEGVTFGSVVTEVDLETLNHEEWNELYELWIERALLIFPEAFLRPEGQDDFAKRFGELEFPRAALSNIGKDCKVLDTFASITSPTSEKFIKTIEKALD